MKLGQERLHRRMLGHGERRRHGCGFRVSRWGDLGTIRLASPPGAFPLHPGNTGPPRLRPRGAPRGRRPRRSPFLPPKKAPRGLASCVFRGRRRGRPRSGRGEGGRAWQPFLTQGLAPDRSGHRRGCLVRPAPCVFDLLAPGRDGGPWVCLLEGRLCGTLNPRGGRAPRAHEQHSGPPGFSLDHLRSSNPIPRPWPPPPRRGLSSLRPQREPSVFRSAGRW